MYKCKKYYGKILLISFYIGAFFNIVLEGNSIVGIFMTGVLFFLSAFAEFPLAAPIILIANDALGTAIAGRISFPLVYSMLIVWRYILIKRCAVIGIRTFGCICVSLFLIIHLYLFQTHSIAGIFSTAEYFFIICYLVETTSIKEIEWNQICLWMGISCFLLALHLVFLGGIAYIEIDDGNGLVSNFTQMRYGLIGTGVGDPNYSGLKLILGSICIYYTVNEIYFRFPLLIIIILGMVRTVSVTTVLILLVIICVGILLNKGIGKKIKNGMLIILSVVAFLFILSQVPIDKYPDGLQMMFIRIEQKIGQLISGNIVDMTTGRSERALNNLQYAFGRSGIRWFIGGDNIPPNGLSLSHNTYVDLLIRFGMIGFIFLGVQIVKRTIRCFKICLSSDFDKEKICIFQIKILYIMFGFGLSIYMYQEAALWVLFLLIL